MAPLTPAVTNTARQCHQSVGRDGDEGAHGCPLLGCMVWVDHMDVPRPPAHVQGGPAWTEGKPSAGKAALPPALGVCPHPIKVALASGLLLVVGAVGEQWQPHYLSKKADWDMWPQQGMGSQIPVYTVLSKLSAELLGSRAFFSFLSPFFSPYANSSALHWLLILH